MTSQGIKITKQPHHVQEALCTTRASYRQGRKLTAVKVYTVNNESSHLLIHGVPSIGLIEEVTRLCRRYGDIKPVQYVEYPDRENFTDVFHVTYKKIQAARFAKNQIDTKNFFGNILHVFYAPELETLAETRNKLITRRKEVSQKISKLQKEKGNQDVFSNKYEKKQEGYSSKNSGDSVPQSSIATFHQEPCTSMPLPSTFTIPEYSQSLHSTPMNQLVLNTESNLSAHRQPQTFTVTSASQGESIADFYKIYNMPVAITIESSIGPAMPQEVTNETQLCQLSNSNPYKTNAPFERDKPYSYVTNKKVNDNSKRQKRKHADACDDFSNKTRTIRSSGDFISIKSHEILPGNNQTIGYDNREVGNLSSNLSPTPLASNVQKNSSSSSKVSSSKFKFIPRQVISKKC